MKMVAVIVETVNPKDDFIIVRFDKDPKKQHFVLYMADPWVRKWRRFDSCIIDVKWRSVVLDDGNGNKAYDTQLYTDEQVWDGTQLPKKPKRN